MRKCRRRHILRRRVRPLDCRPMSTTMRTVRERPVQGLSRAATGQASAMPRKRSTQRFSLRAAPTQASGVSIRISPRCSPLTKCLGCRLKLALPNVCECHRDGRLADIPTCSCWTGAASAALSIWIGGQGVVPLEQKTQQSPGFGRRPPGQSRLSHPRRLAGADALICNCIAP